MPDIITTEEMARRLREFASAPELKQLDFEINDFWLKDALSSAANVIENLRDQIRDQMKDYDEYATERRQLVRQLDVAMHGEEGAAKQASLCDLIPSAEMMREELKTLRADRASHVMTRAIEEPVRDRIIDDCIKIADRERKYFTKSGANAATRIIDCLRRIKTSPSNDLLRG